MNKIQKAYNGCAPMQAEHTIKPNVPPAVAMEVTGAEAMLGFDPRSAEDDYEDAGYEEYGLEQYGDIEDPDVF